MTEAELRGYVDGLWANDYVEYFGSTNLKRERVEAQVAGQSAFEFQRSFGDIGWRTPENVIEMPGPRAPNGAEADYFYDPATRTAYHRATYW